jgi:hypothetical protein
VSLFALLCVNAPPAGAIFGIGACEKLKKSILSEEKIGRESWVFYTDSWKAHNRDPKWNVFLADALAEIHKSDKIVWSLAAKNKKCFTPKENAEIRRQLSFTNKTLNDYRDLLKEKNFKYVPFDWSIWYPSYASLFEVLAESKSKKG